MLHHHGFTAFGLRHNQSALAFANGRNDVDDATGDVFSNFFIAFDIALQAHLLFGEQRRQVFKHHFVLVLIGTTAVDFVQLVQSKVTLAVFGGAYFAFNHVTGVQVKTAHLAGADVDVVG